MPGLQQKRPSVTQSSQGGHKFDLGGLLMAMFGGVDAVPLAAAGDAVDAVGATEAANAGTGESSGIPGPNEGKAPVGSPSEIPQKGPTIQRGGSGLQFKPRSIFDSAAAANMQSQFDAQQFAADADVGRKIRLQNAMDSLAQTNEPNKYRAMTGPTLERSQGESDIRQKETEKNAVNQMLLNKSLMPANAQQYQSDITPRVMQSEFYKTGADIEKNRGEETLNKINADTTQASAADLIGRGLADNRFNNLMSQGNVDNAATILKSKMDQIRQAAPIAEANSLAGRFRSVNPGDTVVDQFTGRPIYSAPPANPLMNTMNAMNQLKNAGNNTNATNINTPNPQPQGGTSPASYTINDLIIDPTSGRILGVKKR